MVERPMLRRTHRRGLTRASTPGRAIVRPTWARRVVAAWAVARMRQRAGRAARVVGAVLVAPVAPAARARPRGRLEPLARAARWEQAEPPARARARPGRRARSGRPASPGQRASPGRPAPRERRRRDETLAAVAGATLALTGPGPARTSWPS